MLVILQMLEIPENIKIPEIPEMLEILQYLSQTVKTQNYNIDDNQKNILRMPFGNMPLRDGTEKDRNTNMG